MGWRPTSHRCAPGAEDLTPLPKPMAMRFGRSHFKQVLSAAWCEPHAPEIVAFEYTEGSADVGDTADRNVVNCAGRYPFDRGVTRSGPVAGQDDGVQAAGGGSTNQRPRLCGS